MSNPREILRQIRQRQGAGLPRADTPRTPAPAPIAAPAPPQPAAPVSAQQQSARPGSQTASVAQTAPVTRNGGHALYSELMRSHDRMGTRHLKRNE